MIRFAPCGVESECKSVETHHEALSEANPGVNVGFNVLNVTVNDILRGHVASERRTSLRWAARTSRLRSSSWRPRQIRKGYTPVLDCYTSHIAYNFDTLQKLDRRTGKELEAEAWYIKNGDSTLVLVVPTKRCASIRSWSTPSWSYRCP